MTARNLAERFSAMRRRGDRSLEPGQDASVVRVAQYVRMSTDHQRYSTENQAESIRQYAHQRGMVIVRTYADEGKSGLNLEGRDALKQLIRDVQAGDIDFSALLVYDISRWGRFQDADESAYYEYICRRAGLRVIYCAEPFENDGSPMAVIMKSVKRAMAGEYSRELSTKVFIGQCRLVELGFRQGGAPGFGLRRVLINERGEIKSQLSRGERKSFQTDRVILQPGPAEEAQIVRQIYERFVLERRREREIADELNDAKIPHPTARAWSRSLIHQVLTNEKYVGNNVYNRTSFKLKKKRVANPRTMWVRKDGAFQGIVDEHLFAAAAAIISARNAMYDDSAMLESLGKLFRSMGVLSGLVIDEQEDMPSSGAYRSRFGSLLRAYSLVGFEPARDYRYLEINRRLRQRIPEAVSEIVTGLRSVGASVEQDPRTDLLLVNQQFTVSIAVVRCIRTPAGALRWRMRFDTTLRPDLTVAIRMAPDNREVLDYYVFPCIDLPMQQLRLAEDNEFNLDAYRFCSFEAVYSLAAKAPLSMAA